MRENPPLDIYVFSMMVSYHGVARSSHVKPYLQ